MILRLSRRHFSYTDVEYVDGMKTQDKTIEMAFYEVCRRQFIKGTSKYMGLNEDDKDDMFSESYILMWEKIRDGQIFVRDQKVFAKGSKEVKIVPDIIGYFMRIVKNKYLESLRKNNKTIQLPEQFGSKDEIEEAGTWWDESPAEKKDRIVNECVKNLPKRCFEILTMFYYKNMSLEDILAERKENQSYDGLKSGKSKCMKNLKNQILISFANAGLSA